MVGLVLAGMFTGPHGLNWLANERIGLRAFGTFGLLQCSWLGSRLILALLDRVKRGAILFAACSFAIPLVLGIGSARFLGYAWAGAVLMGSNWASHTPVTYPILRQMGLAKNPAIATVIGATPLTDTLALLVLTGVSAATSRGTSIGFAGTEPRRRSCCDGGVDLLYLPE